MLHFLCEVIPLEKYYGHRLRILHACNEQAMTTALTQMELTSAQGLILGYLAHHDAPPCSRDLEDFFHLSHPTVSGLLARMEKKGFIALRTDETDRRCRRIHILPKGRQCTEMMHAAILANEEKLVQGFSEEDKERFFSYLDRAIANLGGYSCRHKQKEEL